MVFFLEKDIEKALDRGLIAIVPNVNLDPADPEETQNDQIERSQRLQAWEKTKVKEYKTIVLVPDHPEVNNRSIFDWMDGKNSKPLADLNGRPLKFITAFRPRARYIWWTFMSAILQQSWRAKQAQSTLGQIEVNKAVRYWGTRSRYAKKILIRGFIDQLGQDIKSILEHGIDDEDPEEPDPRAIAVMASEVIKTQILQMKTMTVIAKTSTAKVPNKSLSPRIRRVD